jgi:succinoglycan biosynthesis protein ExoA
MNSPTELETVSVVIPCYNEERYIGESLERLVNQYPPERYEIIIVDGISHDRTRAVVQDYKTRHPELSVSIIDNPARNIPTALNLGVQAARGSIIARMDAHAIPSSGYIRRCVEVITQDEVGVVGMPCIVRPGADTLIAKAIASAVSHPFGIGDAKYRLGGTGPAQESVDTVAFACFRKSLWLALGGFNEALITNEDYDFNYRVRKSGQRVVLDRAEHSDYFARSSLAALAMQYSRYGAWKAAMIRLAPRSIKLRHLIAPVFVLSLTVLSGLALIWPPVRWLLLAELALYLLGSLSAGFNIARRTGAGFKIIVLMPIVFATIHLSWGTSFLLGLIKSRAIAK